ncbi:MAG: RNA-binding cell elongation regulator Jag/EloR [Clostridia bacterium]
MPRTVIAEGKTSTEAIEKGLKELKVSRNQVDVKILEEKKKSFFNILEPHIVKVELTVREEANNNEISHTKKIEEKEVSKENMEQAKSNINIFLKDFLGKISQDIKYSLNSEENVINVVVEGEASTRLIGYRGEALNALQTILSTIANKGQETTIKVILDIGSYKDARKKTLEELSEKIEKTVTKTGKAITLEPMTAYERKIIHTKLQNSKTVKTYSIGEGDRRRIVISKK